MAWARWPGFGPGAPPVGELSRSAGGWRALGGRCVGLAVGDLTAVHRSSVIGDFTAVTGDGSSVIGDFAAVTGDGSSVIGDFTAVTGNRSSVILNRRGAGELLALVLADELVVSETALVQGGTFLMQVRRGAFLGGFLLRDAGPLLGDLGLLLSGAGLPSVLICDLIATLAQFAFPSLESRLLTHPRERQRKRDEDQHHYDDHDDEGC